MVSHDAASTHEGSTKETASYVREFMGSWLRASDAVSLTFGLYGFQGVQYAMVDSNIEADLLESADDIQRITMQLSNPTELPVLQTITTADQIRTIQVETGFSSKEGDYVYALRMLNADGNQYVLPPLLTQSQSEDAIARGVVNSIRDFKQAKKSGVFAPAGLTRPDADVSPPPAGQLSTLTAVNFGSKLSRMFDRANKTRRSEEMAKVLVNNLLQKATHLHVESYAQLLLQTIGEDEDIYIALMPKANQEFSNNSAQYVRRLRRAGGWDDVWVWNSKHPISNLADDFEIYGATLIETDHIKPNAILCHITIPISLKHPIPRDIANGYLPMPSEYIDIVIGPSRDVMVYYIVGMNLPTQYKIKLPKTFDSDPTPTHQQLEEAIDVILPVDLRVKWRQALQELSRAGSHEGSPVIYVGDSKKR